MRLSPHEIRACVSFGGFSSLLRDLNSNAEWRSIFGKPSPRLKDEELILRFFALLHRGNTYKKPMREFLDDFLDDNRELNLIGSKILTKEFSDAIAVAHSTFGDKVFRIGPSLNAAIYDSVLVGIAKRLTNGPIKDKKAFTQTYFDLLKNEDYETAFIRATSDDENVRNRLKIAADAFSKVP